MAMRRPRIKPVANIQLNSKRKAKSTNDVKIVKVGESHVNCMQEDEKQIEILRTQAEEDSESIGNGFVVKGEHLVYTETNRNNLKNGIYEKENNKGAQIVQEVETVAEENINNENKNSNQKNIANVNVDSINNAREQHSKNAYEDVSEALNDSEAFKFPPKVEFQRAISHASNSGLDDVFYSDIEENALQMDLEKSSLSSCPMSPSKNLTRQRIRPTPHFGQRRNSFVGTSPSPHTSGSDDNHPSNFNTINDLAPATQTRRERNNSTSFAGNITSHHHYCHTPHKYLPTGITNSTMGRIRTESGCSSFSDNTSTHKSRKTEDHSKSSRRDFEARFHNGVPEKSAIKMSDLIYYNPATNPMEQKPNQNVKSEQTETSSNDVKPFTEKLEKDTDISTESEAAPVPQLKLNAKGELILDDKSLVIETTAEQEARKVLANSSLIYLDENTGMNGFYSRQKRTREWVPSETIKFYRCLQNVGTDFSLMVSLFPNRTRRDLKLKFKKEERKNGHLINKALLYPKQFDIESLKQQIDEEEKLREEQAKMAKKLKEAKKRKINVSSRANRVLLKGDIYQNENNQKPKRIRKTNKNKERIEDIAQNENESITKPNDSVEMTHNESMQKLKQKKTKSDSKKINEDEMITSKDTVNNDNITDLQTNESDNVVKRRRRRTPNKALKDEIVIIKEEITKSENRPDSIQTSAQTECQDAKQLQTEIDELLESDEIEMQYGDSSSYEASTQIEQYNKQIMNTPPYPVLKTTHFEENFVETDTDMNKNEQKTFINLDDGSVNVYDSIKDDNNDVTQPTVDLISPHIRSQSPLTASSPLHVCPTEIEHNSLESATIPERDIINNDDTCSSVISERELNEDDIQNILTELAEGSLVLVSTLDPDDPDKVLNEIYMVDKNTGNLCDEPLSIPDNIVECILTLVS